MKFDTKSESPKLFFKAMRWLNDDEYETVERAGESPDAEKAVTMTVAKMDGVRAAPAKLEGKPPAKAKVAAPVEEEEAEEPPPPPKAKKAVKAAAPVEEVDEPEVRTAPKQPVVDKKSSLVDMVSEWDDE